MKQSHERVAFSIYTRHSPFHERPMCCACKDDPAASGAKMAMALTSTQKFGFILMPGSPTGSRRERQARATKR